MEYKSSLRHVHEINATKSDPIRCDAIQKNRKRDANPMGAGQTLKSASFSKWPFEV
jgi:hypothetical protein